MGKIITSIFVLFIIYYFQKVLMFPNKFIFGYLGDQVMLFFYKWWIDNYEFLGGSSVFTQYLGYPFGYSLVLSFLNQPILWQCYFFLSSLIGTVPAYNLLVVFSFALNFVFFYIAYSLYSRKRILLNVTEGYYLAFFFSINTHLFLHAKNHLDLLQIWIIPLGFSIYRHNINKSLLSGLYTGLLMVCFLAISNYYAYMLFILIGLYTLLLLSTSIRWPKFIDNYIFANLFENKKSNCTRLNLKFIAGALIAISIGSYSIMHPFLKPIYSKSTEFTQVSGFRRSIYDFVSFSSRPWYYFLPSTLNPFTGVISEQALNKISSSSNYLTQHYFAEEHAGNYLGYVTICIFVYALIKSHKNLDVKFALIMIICFLILSLPPVITWNLHDFYLPSYLLYKLFPMFRVLSRFSVVIYMLMLFVSGNALKSIIDKGQVRYLLILIILLFVHATDMFIPPRLVDISNPPEVYSYLGKVYPHQSVAVYPYERSVSTVFWINIHKNKIMNPRDYINKESNFNSKTFTEHLLSDAGITEFVKNGGNTLVVFADKLSQTDLSFLQGEPRLKLVATFDDAYLYSLK